MKKFSFFFIFTAIMAFAQQPSTQQGVQPNLKTGINFSSITNDKVKGNDDYSSVFGFQLGVAFDIGIMNIGTNAFYFQPGLMFITKGNNYNYSKKGYDEYNKPFNLSEEATWSLYYLELPLMALLKIPVSENLAVALNAGPYFALGLSGTKTYEWNGFDEKTKGEIDIFDNNVQRERLGRFDAGLGFGAGIEYKSYYIGLSYDLGLKDMAYNAVQVGGSNRTFGINLGYSFGQAPKEEKQPEPPPPPQPVAQPEPPPPEPQPVVQPEPPPPEPQPVVQPEPEPPKKSEKDSLAEIQRMEAQKKLEALNSKAINVYRDARGTILSLSDILFESGKADLKPELRENLAEIAALLKSLITDANVIVEGHTDNVGNEASNHKLSADRAYAVMKYLVDRGVSQERLSSRGYGLTKPIADNSTKEGKAKNRRVELIIQDKEPEPVLAPAVPETQEVPQQEQPEHPVPQPEPQVQPPPEPQVQQPQLEPQPKAEQPSVQPEPQVQQPQPQPEQQAQTEQPARHTITVDVMTTVTGIVIGKVGKKFFDSMLEDFKFKDMDDVNVSVNTDLSGLGFAFQYEYQPFQRMSFAAKFAYLDMGASMNSKVTKSIDILEVGLNSKLEGDISLLSAEGHLRTYTFDGVFFLDLVLGYTDVSMSFKGEDLIESDFGTMELESIKFKASQGFFKPGFKFGWRVSFGKNGGFVFEPALNFCYAMRLGSSSLVEQIMKETGRKYSKNVKNIDEKMELIESIGLIGGPGLSLSFGYRF